MPAQGNPIPPSWFHRLSDVEHDATGRIWPPVSRGLRAARSSIARGFPLATRLLIENCLKSAQGRLKVLGIVRRYPADV